MATKHKYYEAVGRRKTSIARVRLLSDSKEAEVNGISTKKYFPTAELQKISNDAFLTLHLEGKFGISAKITGGGIHSQAEALRHAISRALLKVDPEYRPVLKKEGFLRRDQRAKERRKFGLKKARKAPQWAKR